jgi:ABC-type uncharacterized transport system permease subunit
MQDLLSLVYGQAPLFAAIIAVVYAALALHGTVYPSIGKPSNGVQLTLFFTVIAHSLLLSGTIWMPASPHSVALGLGFAQMFSLATCVGVWLFVVESRWVAIDALRPLALSAPAIAVLLAAWTAPTTSVLTSGAAAHVLVAIAAHGVALLACGHAVLLLALSRVLKNNAASGWAQSLSRHCPPLVVLERLLIRLSLWVAALLSLTVALGVVGGVIKFDHKTVLTLISLTIWVFVAWAYKYRAWRGTKLCLSVFLATGVLLLAYIGSRFVLQAILHR